MRESVCTKDADSGAHHSLHLRLPSLLVLLCFVVALRTKHVDKGGSIGILCSEWSRLNNINIVITVFIDLVCLC